MMQWFELYCCIPAAVVEWNTVDRLFNSAILQVRYRHRSVAWIHGSASLLSIN